MGGPQSAPAPVGAAARVLAELFAVMTIRGAPIWPVTMAIAVHAARVRPGAHPEKAGQHLIFWDGVVFPVVVLAAPLGYVLPVTAGLRGDGPVGAPGSAGLGRARGGDEDLPHVHMSGEQGWWRVDDDLPGSDQAVVSTNGNRMPMGRPVEFTLTSPEVIRSCLIPALGGKFGTSPNQLNRFVLEADATGSFRGARAEFCGTSQALMVFAVETMEPAALDGWIAAQAQSVSPCMGGEDRDVFMASGCDASHALRDTAADGAIDPDPPHLVNRRRIAAGILPDTAGRIAGRIADAQSRQPGNKMPPCDGLTGRELRVLATWLAGLGREAARRAMPPPTRGRVRASPRTTRR